MVSSAEPGAACVPTELNQSGPYLAIRARCASVSTLFTSVGRPPTPRANGRGGTNTGSAEPPLRKFTSADSSLATYLWGKATS